MLVIGCQQVLRGATSSTSMQTNTLETGRLVYIVLRRWQLIHSLCSKLVWTGVQSILWDKWQCNHLGKSKRHNEATTSNKTRTFSVVTLMFYHHWETFCSSTVILRMECTVQQIHLNASSVKCCSTAATFSYNQATTEIVSSYVSCVQISFPVQQLWSRPIRKLLNITQS